MRRLLFTAALLFLLAIPVCAQRRAGFAPHMGGGAPRVAAGAPRGGMAVRSSRGIVINGGFGFGHAPGFFFRPRHHRGFFFRPFPFFNPFFSPFPFGNAFPIYPYSNYGLQSDFVYSNAAMQPSADYSAAQTAALSNEVSRLQAEVEIMRREQASQAQVDRQQYALNSPAEAPQPIPSTRPRQEATRPQAPAQPTVLVYRDGRRVEIHNYAVVGQTLWVFSEERARKVPLADLDLDATRQANEERGIDFSVRPPSPPAQRNMENSPSQPKAPPAPSRAAGSAPLAIAH